MAENRFVALVMAGGSGTRFWPLSQETRPKQYLALTSSRSLIQQTVDRVAPLVRPNDVFVCSTASQRPLLDEQLPSVKGLILEPFGRNTAPCLILSVLSLLRQGYDESTVMCVLPADHFIKNEKQFVELLRQAGEVATTQNGLVTLGITPTYAHTGYGYIQGGAALNTFRYPVSKASCFVEKPDRVTAVGYLKEGNFYWNAGIFIWTLGSIRRAFQEFMPTQWKALEAAKSESEIKTAYEQLKSEPIDKAVMEKSSSVFVIPADIGWSDIGSWNALHELVATKPNDNLTVSGNAKFFAASGNLVHAPEGKRIALIGVDNLIVVDTGDTLLVVPREKDQEVRSASEAFRKK